jgi:hypothetical protein
MAVDLSNLIFVLRDKLSEIGIDHYDDRLAYRDLKDASDTIDMIALQLQVDLTDYTEFPTKHIERCTVRVGTYHAYRNYTRLAERQNGSLPSAAGLTVTYDITDAKNCLSLLFGTTFTDELIPEVIERGILPIATGQGPSIINP